MSTAASFWPPADSISAASSGVRSNSRSRSAVEAISFLLSEGMAEALLIIDFQNDFTPGGALGVEGGDEIAGRLNELALDPRFELVAATRDWHPADHGSFREQGGIWPVHCVAGTEGAELHSGLHRSRLDAVVDKGAGRRSRRLLRLRGDAARGAAASARRRPRDDRRDRH